MQSAVWNSSIVSVIATPRPTIGRPGESSDADSQVALLHDHFEGSGDLPLGAEQD